MALSVGIIGLPNVGKSTLFNALLGRQVADVAEYPFCTIEPNVGVVGVPDIRLDRLWKEARNWKLEAGGLKIEKSSLQHPASSQVSSIQPQASIKKVPAAIQFVDIAGLVKGAHKGEGLGNQFLAHIREVDVICHVVRDFEAANVARAGGSSEPKSDIELVNTELILKDLETVEKALAKITRAERLKKDKATVLRLSALENLKAGLSEGKLAKNIELSEKEQEVVEELFLLTMKPVVCVRNISEIRIQNSEFRMGRNEDFIEICAKLEMELAELEPEERKEYMKELGIKESGLDRLIKSCYKLLDLITFFTVEGGKQVQAWPIRGGSTILEAAAMVHSDFAEKFIRAEVVGFGDLIAAGSMEKARNMGRVRTEGKSYTVKDGDVIAIKI